MQETNILNSTVWVNSTLLKQMGLDEENLVAKETMSFLRCLTLEKTACSGEGLKSPQIYPKYLLPLSACTSDGCPLSQNGFCQVYILSLKDMHLNCFRGFPGKMNKLASICLTLFLENEWAFCRKENNWDIDDRWQERPCLGPKVKWSTLGLSLNPEVYQKGFAGGDRKVCHTSRRPYFTSKPNLPFHFTTAKPAPLVSEHMSEIFEW